ncbi:MAG: hypothetical protein Q7S63_01870 [bacterium]|nr:hypothetical protein [bacterium]
MDKQVTVQILQAFSSKGWNLYYVAKSGEKIDPEETIQKGPVQELEEDTFYDILPRVQNPKDWGEINSFLARHQTLSSIEAPSGEFAHAGRMIAQFLGGNREEFGIPPDFHIEFIGIELREEEVRLLAPTVTFMPYDMFLEALKTLPDITGLTAVAS